CRLLMPSDAAYLLSVPFLLGSSLPDPPPIPPQAVEAPVVFGCGQVQTGLFLEGPASDGLLGLGMEKASLPSVVATSGLVASNSFSMCFSRDGVGRIHFGDAGSRDQDETPFIVSTTKFDMRRKRQSPVVEISSSDGTDDSDFERPEKYRIHHRKKFGRHQFSAPSSDSDEHVSSEEDSLDPVLYHKYLKERKKLKMIEHELKRSLRHKAKKPKASKSNRDAFTRFSVTTMSKLITNMSSRYKKVISDSGFGSLLEFDKCYVPKKFVKWVASLVDTKSGDIIYDGKVIPLTKESVHCVLELPNGDKPFPSDTSIGKAIILSKFDKHTIPPASFFEEKLLSDHSMCDDDVLTCFLLVVMQSFLCCNSSLVPSYKYFGIFENVSKAKEYDICGYVLDWTLDSVRTYNEECLETGTDHHTLGGCWYFLAVLFLDHVDFGSHQPSDLLPRISVWKGSMIKNYSDKYMSSAGRYGLRPLLSHSETCYSKTSQLIQRRSSSLADSAEFMEKLDIVSGCKLPQSLKVSICELIERHSLNSSVSVNMNLASLSSLPGDMKLFFTKMMAHCCKVDKRTEDLVLNLLKLVSDAVSDDNELPDYGHIEVQQSDSDKCNISSRSGHVDKDIHQSGDAKGLQCSYSKKSFPNDPMRTSSQIPDVNVKSELPLPNLKSDLDNQCAAQDGSVNVQEITEKMTNNVCVHEKTSTPYKFVVPPNGYPKSFVENVIAKRKEALSIGANPSSVSDAVPAKKPFVDLTNISNPSSCKANMNSSSNGSQHSQRNAVAIDKMHVSAPGPSSKRRVLRQFCSQLATADSDDETPPSPQHTPFYMYSIDDSQEKSREHTPSLSKSMRTFSNRISGGNKQHSQPLKDKVSPEVVITGERSLSDAVRAMSKKSDAHYDAQYNRSSSMKTPIQASAAKASSQVPSQQQASSEFKCRDSSKGGKEPHYGPRRVVFPPSKFREDFVGVKKKYHVTSSEIQNYKAICSLASSSYQKEFAVDISGVRCTYWSLGESLKPGGVVMPYVVSAFCYHLFSKSGGHPDMSKKYYYFPSIGENVLCDPEVAKLEILERALKLSKKARPLQRSDILFFPVFFENHWFVFAVDIIDKKWVFIDSLYKRDDPYQQYVRSKLIPNFQYHWYANGGVDMPFDQYTELYPDVPFLDPEHAFDAGIYVMLFLELWHSPRTLLSQLFDSSDVPNIRIKIANTLWFLHHNVGKKYLVTDFKHEEDK
ncbi:hypothetical protein EJB05_24070, partial [Eragrostis curvula]